MTTEHASKLSQAQADAANTPGQAQAAAASAAASAATTAATATATTAESLTPERAAGLVAEYTRLIYEKGFVSNFEGNVSIRLDDTVYISPSRVYKNSLNAGLISRIDMDGVPRGGPYKPSSEAKIHIGAYKDRPDIGAVVHTHSPFAAAHAIANKSIETKAYPEMIVRCGRIPLAAYGTPSTDEVYAAVRPFIKDHNIILLANHGIMAVGKDIEEAFYRAEAAEGFAKILYLASQLGGEVALSSDKLDVLARMFE